jgi:stage V sporulation protein G
MQISEVQIKVTKPQDGLLGFGSLILDNSLYLGSIAIFSKLDGSGLRIVYPSKKIGDQNLQIFHPINRELGQKIEEAIIKKANKIFNENT